MYFRLTSLPELRHLTLSERRELIRTSIGSSITRSIFPRSLGFGIMFGIVEMALIHASWLRDQFPAWFTLFLTSTVSTFVIYWIYLVRIRGGVLLYVEAQRKSHRLPMCLECGYNLEGVANSTCPECGAHIGSGLE